MLFLRDREVNDVVVVSGKTLHSLSLTRVINTFSKVDDDLYLVSMSNNINTDLLKELNVTLSSEYVSPQMSVNTNVAIASAVTAYGRILMMQYKVLDCVVYSDTDSLFTTDLKPFTKRSLSHVSINKRYCMNDALMGYIIPPGYYYQSLDSDIEDNEFKLGRSVLYILETLGYKLRVQKNKLCFNPIKTIKVHSNNGTFKVNGHRLKPYMDGRFESLETSIILKDAKE